MLIGDKHRGGKKSPFRMRGIRNTNVEKKRMQF